MYNCDTAAKLFTGAAAKKHGISSDKIKIFNKVVANKPDKSQLIWNWTVKENWKWNCKSLANPHPNQPDWENVISVEGNQRITFDR